MALPTWYARVHYERKTGKIKHRWEHILYCGMYERSTSTGEVTNQLTHITRPCDKLLQELSDGFCDRKAGLQRLEHTKLPIECDWIQVIECNFVQDKFGLGQEQRTEQKGSEIERCELICEVQPTDDLLVPRSKFRRRTLKRINIEGKKNVRLEKAFLTALLWCRFPSPEQSGSRQGDVREWRWEWSYQQWATRLSKVSIKRRCLDSKEERS